MAADPLDDARRRADDVVRTARDALYVGVGLGLLAFQATQVRRRELERDLGVRVPPTPAELSRLRRRLPGLP